MSHHNLVVRLQNEIKAANLVIEQHAKALAENPAQAMMWSGKAFTAAATLDVVRPLLARLTEKVDTSEEQQLLVLTKHLQNLLYNGLVTVSSSGSPTHVLYAQERMAAVARICKVFVDAHEFNYVDEAVR